MDYLEKLCDKKAKENNTIDLNAYAIGIEDSKASYMLELLKEFQQLACDYDLRPEDEMIDFSYKVNELIKEATEL